MSVWSNRKIVAIYGKRVVGRSVARDVTGTINRMQWNIDMIGQLKLYLERFQVTLEGTLWIWVSRGRETDWERQHVRRMWCDDVLRFKSCMLHRLNHKSQQSSWEGGFFLRRCCFNALAWAWVYLRNLWLRRFTGHCAVKFSLTLLVSLLWECLPLM